MLNSNIYKSVVIILSIISLLITLIYLYFNLRMITKILSLGFDTLEIALENAGYTPRSFFSLLIIGTILKILFIFALLGLLRFSEYARRFVIIYLLMGICWELIEYFMIEKRLIFEDILQYAYLIIALMVLTNRNIKSLTNRKRK